MCHIAIPAISVVLAVLLTFSELNVPFKNVSAGCESGRVCCGVYKSDVRRSREQLVGVSYENPTWLGYRWIRQLVEVGVARS